MFVFSGILSNIKKAPSVMVPKSKFIVKKYEQTMTCLYISLFPEIKVILLTKLRVSTNRHITLFDISKESLQLDLDFQVTALNIPA